MVRLFFTLVLFVSLSPSAPAEDNSGEGLYKSGTFVELSQDIVLREKPQGQKKGVLLKGEQVQIISNKLSENDDKGHRYYQIFTPEKKIGYIYAGTRANYSKWLTQVWRSKAPKFLASAGDSIKIKNKNGISIRTKPGKKRISLIEPGQTVTVRSIVQDKEGKVYYKIKHRSYKGYIYAGNLEKRSLGYWTEVL